MKKLILMIGMIILLCLITTNVMAFTFEDLQSYLGKTVRIVAYVESWHFYVEEIAVVIEVTPEYLIITQPNATYITGTGKEHVKYSNIKEIEILNDK